MPYYLFFLEEFVYLCKNLTLEKEDSEKSLQSPEQKSNYL